MWLFQCLYYGRFGKGGMLLTWGRMSDGRTRMEITRNLVYIAKCLYPWILNIPDSWPEFVKFLNDYTPSIYCKVVYWKVPRMRAFKCNANSASKANLGPSLGAFCVRDNIGNVVYVEVVSLWLD